LTFMDLNTDVLGQLDPRQVGQELARARKKNKLTQDDAAKLLEVARTTITAIEKGDRRVRPAELLTLARAYNAQLSDFVRPRPSVPSFRERVQFRGPFSRTNNDEELIDPYIEEFENLCRDYLELEEITQTPLRPRYPPQAPLESARLAQSAEALALEERGRLGLGDGPVPMLRDVLEQEVGLRVFFIEMPAKFSEMYVCDDAIGACMAINRNHPEERRRWSMAHAYAHFLTSRYDKIVSVEGQGRFRSELPSEQFAEYFTPGYLMPTAGLLRRVGEIRAASNKKLPISDVLRVAHRYGVSPQALVRRLEDLRELPSGTWTQMRERVSIKEAQDQLELGPVPGRDKVVPIRYHQLALSAFDDGLISGAQLAHLLRMDRLQAQQEARAGSDKDDVLSLQNLQAVSGH
jgi:Zn-dependent peptidase ImmA (M78 family)/DNA-binding XRE family transcriptional regulator